jgi:RHS repeat-associated protein
MVVLQTIDRRSTNVTAAYDGYGRLITYARSGAQSFAHSYNGMDDRVSTATTSGGVTTTRRFVYDMGGRVLGEYGASAAMAEVKAEFIWLSPDAANDNMPHGGYDGTAGYAPLAVSVPGTTAGTTQLTWVHGNHLGVPQLVMNASGTSITPTGYALPGYPGQSQTLADLYYNRYRDYDSSTGRYIQADPIGLAGDVNPYGYANGNPVTGIDPMGLQVAILPAAEAGCAITAEIGCVPGAAIGATIAVCLSFETCRTYALKAGIQACSKSTMCAMFIIASGALFKKADKDCPESKTYVENRGLPPGFWDADRGAEEWGRRNDVGAKEARRRFHARKGGDSFSGAKDKYGVNPDTGEIVNPDGEIDGNLND